MPHAGPRHVTDHETRALVTVETMDRLTARAMEALARGELGTAGLLLAEVRAAAGERMAASVETAAMAEHIRQTAEARLAASRAGATVPPPRAGC